MPDVRIDDGPGVDHPISPVPTSITAFVGRTAQGRPDEPLTVTGAIEMEQEFGPPSAEFPLTAVVRDYFDNGGATAVILKLVSRERPADVPLDLATFQGDGLSTGLHALRRVDFNLLCIPPDNPAGDTSVLVYAEALRVCTDSRAILLIDAPGPPSAPPGAGLAAVVSSVEALRSAVEGARLSNAALYFPRLVKLDPQGSGRATSQVPCGAVAGVIARTDRQRGVWKAPAGTDAAIVGIQGLSTVLNDLETAQLNALGVNCLRLFPGRAPVVWGGRTLAAAESGGEFKYLPVRRLALLIEASVDRGTAWAATERNGEPVWMRLRARVETFMLGLYRDGAFAGRTPRDAFYVRCGRDTATQADIDAGIMNIEIGFAPLKPAEFIIVRIQRMLMGSR